MSELTRLVELISSSVQVVISEYAAAGHPPPSLNSVTPGPFDTPEDTSARLAKAIQIIEAACAQLSFTVASPGHVVANKAYEYEESACLLVVTNAKIADLLLDKPGGLHVDVLGKQANLDAGKLGRILRMLATRHCFTEVEPNVFANNRLSVKLLSTDPVASLVGLMTDESAKAGAYLSETLTNPETGFSYSPIATPFQRAHGCAFFDYYETPDGKKRADRFAQSMVGWGAVTGKRMLKKAYPWEKLPANTSIVDIGGGNGHATLELARAFPGFKVTLQDLAPVIEQGKRFWAEEFPEAISGQRVNFVPLDFFKGTPVTDQDFYYIRHVLHDWPDAECLKILSNIRKSVRPSSRLLIHEMVLQHQVRNHGANGAIFDEAPEPLLPNYGVGRVRLYQQDLNMMTILNSKERTLQEFINLGEQAGFTFIKVWDSGETGVVEFSPS